jgi:hypothetical protein
MVLQAAWQSGDALERGSIRYDYDLKRVVGTT